MKWKAKQKNKKKLQRKRNWTKAVAEGRVVRLPVSESTASYFVYSDKALASEAVARSVADGIDAKVLTADKANSHWLWANK